MRAQPHQNDTAWERRQLDLWLTPDDHRLKRQLLRRKFTVPAHWTAGRIMLCADVPLAQFFHETRMFLDGVAWSEGRKSVDGPYFDTLGSGLQPGTTHLLTLDIQNRSTLSGSRGPIWLYYLPDPRERQDLAGTWEAYSNPLQKTGDVRLPGTVQGMFLSRTVVIASAHSNQHVAITIEGSEDRFSLMINGRLLKRSEQIREHVSVFQVTPMVEFGAENTIELVRSSGMREKVLQRVEIRYYDKGVYP